MEILIAIVCAIVIAFLIMKMMVRSHVKWLEKQSPVGIWIAKNEGTDIILQFEQGPKPELNEGTYKQIMKDPSGNNIREYGSWSTHMHSLHMLILASDIKNHPRFGQDAEYYISYIWTDKISIDGPDRSNITYAKSNSISNVNIDGTDDSNAKGLHSIEPDKGN
jgi:hypothetical protein